MKLIVAGQGKSGTTALYYKLLDAFATPPLGLVEPTGYVAGESDSSVLAKVLIDPPGRVDFDSFQGFDRKILMVRDPRDNLISRILYRAYNRADLVTDQCAVEHFLALLRAKELAPQQHSVLSIIECFDELTGVSSLARLCGHPATGLQFAAGHLDYYIFHYEDLIDGRLAGLGEHLGMALSESRVTVASQHQRVSRSASYGAWRHWLTREDCDYFEPHFRDYLKTYGYDQHWRLAPTPKLDPATGSAYVLKIINERRGELNLPAL